MTGTTKQILANEEIIALDQDWAGKQGYKPRDDGDTEVWTKPMSDGSAAVALFDRGLTAAPMSATAAELRLPEARGSR
ncbi:hypothetical protein [Amycolatopsis australiensis]|uniref:hypothetical protein n=1 Tax=Amycolatopsis australiensis TaxID=546364 RepID=UPI003CCB7B48